MPLVVRIPGPLRSYTHGAGTVRATGHTLAEVLDDLDRQFPGIIYVPENAEFSVLESCIKWQRPNGESHQLTLRADEIYVLPWGTKIRLEKQIDGTAWRLVASRADRGWPIG